MAAKIQPRPASRPIVRPPLPQGQDDVALVDINDVKALTRMSSSWLHAEVAAGRFPAPVIRQPRCSRWTLASVRKWLIERVAQAHADAAAAEGTTARTKPTSAAAQARRSSRSEV